MAAGRQLEVGAGQYHPDSTSDRKSGIGRTPSQRLLSNSLGQHGEAIDLSSLAVLCRIVEIVVS